MYDEPAYATFRFNHNHVALFSIFSFYFYFALLYTLVVAFFLTLLALLPRPFNPLCTLESTESLEYSITRILLMRSLISLDCLLIAAQQKQQQQQAHIDRPQGT